MKESSVPGAAVGKGSCRIYTEGIHPILPSASMTCTHSIPPTTWKLLITVICWRGYSVPITGPPGTWYNRIAGNVPARSIAWNGSGVEVAVALGSGVLVGLLVDVKVGLGLGVIVGLGPGVDVRVWVGVGVAVGGTSGSSLSTSTWFTLTETVWLTFSTIAFCNATTSS